MKCKCCKGCGEVIVLFGMFAQNREKCPVCKGKGKVNWFWTFLKGWL